MSHDTLADFGAGGPADARPWIPSVPAEGIEMPLSLDNVVQPTHTQRVYFPAFDGRTGLMDAAHDVTDRAFARILGQEIRRAREARGWSRVQLVEQVPSGIGDRTLLSYEHGIRQLSVVRFVEISKALGVAASELLARALEKARDLSSFSLWPSSPPRISRNRDRATNPSVVGKMFARGLAGLIGRTARHDRNSRRAFLRRC